MIDETSKLAKTASFDVFFVVFSKPLFLKKEKRKSSFLKEGVRISVVKAIRSAYFYINDLTSGTSCLLTIF
ncbi:TPA: hypothetical protein ACF39L_001455 [Enterococcus hirae]